MSDEESLRDVHDARIHGLEMPGSLVERDIPPLEPSFLPASLLLLALLRPLWLVVPFLDWLGWLPGFFLACHFPARAGECCAAGLLCWALY